MSWSIDEDDVDNKNDDVGFWQRFIIPSIIMKLSWSLSSSIPSVVVFGLLDVGLGSADLYVDVKKGRTRTTWFFGRVSASPRVTYLEREQPPQHLPCVWIPLTNIRRQNQPVIQHLPQVLQSLHHRQIRLQSLCRFWEQLHWVPNVLQEAIQLIAKDSGCGRGRMWGEIHSVLVYTLQWLPCTGIIMWFIPEWVVVDSIANTAGGPDPKDDDRFIENRSLLI